MFSFLPFGSGSRFDTDVRGGVVILNISGS